MPTVQAEGTAPDTLEVPPGMFTLDAARVADERTGNAVVDATREALAQTGVLFAPLEIRELSCMRRRWRLFSATWILSAAV